MEAEATLVIVSNTKSPPTINKIDIISIKGNYRAKKQCLQS